MAYGHRFFSAAYVYTFSLTLFFLRTHPSTHSRQGRCFFQYFGSFKEISCFNLFDKSRDVNTNRTTLHTGRIGTVDATTGFHHCLFGRQTKIYFFIVAATFHCILLGHMDTRCHHSFFYFNLRAQVSTPGIISFFFYIPHVSLLNQCDK